VHDAVFRAARNPMLAELIVRSRLYYFNYQLASLYSKEDLLRSHGEHVEVMQAIVSCSADGAESAMRRHLEHSLEFVLARLTSISKDERV
jgi:DNA-binding GntR family transcriptional regulator